MAQKVTSTDIKLALKEFHNGKPSYFITECKTCSRVKNPVFWVQIVLSILTPVLAYAGLTAQDLTTWSKVGELIVGAVSNPYVLSLVAVSVWNTLNDPTTKGLGDSARAKSYTAPQ